MLSILTQSNAGSNVWTFKHAFRNHHRHQTSQRNVFTFTNTGAIVVVLHLLSWGCYIGDYEGYSELLRLWTFLYFLEYRPMEKVQKPSNPECYTQSSEPFRIYVKVVVFWDVTPCNQEEHSIIYGVKS